MKILIIGGNGYIGRHLAVHLADSGHEIIVSSRDPSRAASTSGKRLEYIKWDGTSPEQLTPVIEEVDAVVNLAGENIGALKRWPRKWKSRLLESRTVTGKALATAVSSARSKPSVIIQGSAIGYYGTKANNPNGEGREKGEGFLADLTRQWEESVASIDETGTRLVYIRTGIVLGKTSGFLRKVELSFKFGMGVVPGGPQWISWIHLQDEIQAIRFLIENPKAKGVFNLTAPEPVTMRQLVKTIGKIRRRPAWVTIPPFLIRLALGEMARETILASQDALPEALLDLGYTFEYNNIEDALADLVGSLRRVKNELNSE